MWANQSKESLSSWIDNNSQLENGPNESDASSTIPTVEDEENRDPAVVAYGCQPYKVEVLDKQLIGNSPGAGRRTAVIETLRQMGIQVFVIDAKNTETSAETVNHIKRVVNFATRENSTRNQASYERCLFFQDEQGRLFNLMMAKYVTGPVGTWKEYMESFSGREAMMALTVLCRSLPCVANVDMVQNLKPAYLSLILGLVLSEEISLSWLNASMMIRATSSVSAHALMSPVGSDVLRKLMLFVLVLAGATQGWAQTILTLTGITAACLILLANLGSRAWHFMRWQPMQYTGAGSFLLAYLLAIGTGFLLPFMGHRSIGIGGKGALEYVITTSMLVAVVFMLSDFDGLQKFLVVGSDLCDQTYVNAAVGIWWIVTTLLSLVLVRRIPYIDQHPDNGERLLIEDHASPVGYKVPSLPDFEIDPSMANTGIGWLSVNVEFALGTLFAFLVGAWVIALAFTDWDDRFFDFITGLIADMSA